MLDEFLGVCGGGRLSGQAARGAARALAQGTQGPSANLCPHGEIYF